MNRHLSKSPSDVALARLKVLLNDVNSLYTSGKAVLESDLVNYYHEALNTFFSSLDGSIVDKILKIYAGSPADPVQYNLFTSALSKDVEAIFSEIGALDGMVVSTFNSIISEREQVLQIGKQISNKLGDYLLYADPTLGAGYFFGDSFSSPDRIDVGSSLVSGAECLLSTDEGVVLLPLDGDPVRPRIKSVVINAPSNGISGSNYQLNVFGHDAIEVITDGEPNTWFEYEKVVAAESNTPLKLDLTVVLEQISVINHININPINFGSQTPVKISLLETSKDGKEYTSIKDEVPIKDFVPEDDKEEFSLSGATSKYSGQGFYSFLPRKVQYVHVVLEQHTPYVIETTNGNRLRYAIGIRDINIFGRKFKESGSLVSSLFTISNDAKKISLWASENPIEASSLADISHFISHDDGGTWTQIQPAKRSSFGIPEIINYNNSDKSAIATGGSVNKFRHKISMSRNKKAFDGNVVLKSERESKVDVVNAPTGGNLDVFTTVAPIKDTVRVIMPYMGSFSCPRARYGSSVVGQSPLMSLDFIEFTVDASGIDVREDDKLTGTIRYQLPFRDISNLEDKIRVFYNGSQLEYSPKNEDLYDHSPTSYGTLDSVSKVYFLNNNGKEIQFGTLDASGAQRGFIPQGGGKIQICLDGDNPSLRLTDRGYVLNLSAPSDGIKENISIVAIENSDTGEDFSIDIPSGTDVYKPPAGKWLNTAISSGLSNLKNPAIGSGFERHSFTQETINASDDTARSAGYSADILEDAIQQTEDKTPTSGTFFSQAYEGIIPPIFKEGIENFSITEIDLTTRAQVADEDRQFTEKVEFKDGNSELRNAPAAGEDWELVPTRYTFDPYTGTVYLGSKPGSNRKVTLTCKKVKASIISNDLWEFDKLPVSNKIDTSKIVLDPKAVVTIQKEKAFVYDDSKAEYSINLIEDNERGHDWFNEAIVRGSVLVDKNLFPANSTPVEVPFIDGTTELSNTVVVKDEPITFTTDGSLHTYVLKEINSNKELNVGSLAFSRVRSTSDARTLSSQFDINKKTTETPTEDGAWCVVVSGDVATITLYLETTPSDHCVTYSYRAVDPGVDDAGRYSIDYNKGYIYFSERVQADGTIKFDTASYSAFYNIAKVVQSADIKSITDDGKITFSSAFGMQFIKQDTVNKSRPQILKLLYEFNKASTESLKDLEPYFSPICKDIAFRAVTADLLEEL